MKGGEDNQKVTRDCGKLYISMRVHFDSGTNHVHNTTVRNCMKRNGYYYLQLRKKYLLTTTDPIRRRKYCLKSKMMGLGGYFCRKQISIYLDGKRFQYKYNPMNMTRASKAREWRKKCESLSYGCIVNVGKEGTRNTTFVAGMSYDRGIVLFKQYWDSITREKFVEIVQSPLCLALDKRINPAERRILMVGCPHQNSKVA